MLIGLVVTLIGILIAAAGLRLFMVLLPLSGFIAGVLFGAGLVEAVFGGGFLVGLLSIVVALMFGVILAVGSYFYWYAGAILAAAMSGFAFGAALFGAIGIGPDWLLFLLAVAVATLFSIIALITFFPVFLVIAGTAVYGSALAIGGLLIVLGHLDPQAIGNGDLWRAFSGNILIWLAWIVATGIGAAAQMKAASRIELPLKRWVPVVNSEKQNDTVTPT